MSRIRLGKIEFEHFQGFTQKTVDFQYRKAIARGKNGTGKTSIADGVYWVLYDKNSEGDTKFGIRPVYTDENSPKFCEPIRGLIVMVKFDLCIDGRVTVFKKEQREVVKEINDRTIYSYPNKYWIDDFAMPENKYKKAIEDIVPTDIFKMLTDPDYFNNEKKFKWPERREVLRDMSGDIPEPAGHDDLKAKLKGHSLDDYKKVLTDSKKLYEDEQHDNGVLISDKRKYLKDNVPNADDDEVTLRAKRENAQEDVVKLDKEIQILRGKEKERQDSYKQINEINEKLLHRENIVKNQSGMVDSLNDERASLEQNHADRTQGLVKLQNLIQQGKSAIESAENQIAASLVTLADIKDEYKKAKDKPADEKCFNCGQKLPAEQIADAENKRQTALGNIEARGNRVKAQIADTKAKKAALQDELNKIIAEEKTLVEELKADKAAKDKRIAEIAEEIKNRPQAKPEDDEEWRHLAAERQKINDSLGEPVSEQLEKIQADRDAKTEVIAGLDKALARFDTNQETKDRLTELDGKEKKLAQLIADVNAELDEIKQYKVAQSRLIEAAVNGKFDHVTWRLFEYFQNGDLNDQMCVCLLDGKPYPGLSKGEKAFANNDVQNTLSDYYGVELFRFLEDAGEITLPIETESQLIKLEAVRSINELEVMVEKDSEVAERKANVA